MLGPGALGVTVKSPGSRPENIISTSPLPQDHWSGTLEPGLCANLSQPVGDMGCPAHGCLGLSVLELGPGS